MDLGFKPADVPETLQQLRQHLASHKQHTDVPTSNQYLGSLMVLVFTSAMNKVKECSEGMTIGSDLAGPGSHHGIVMQ